MNAPSQAWRPARALLDLGPDLWDPVAPAAFPLTTLRFRNDRAAAQIGLERLDDAEWIAAFARFTPLPGTLPQPLALRYHGHQFGHYNPELGDGRGFTFAQARDVHDRLMDLGTKGSGQTPWSRFGDGRLTLKGAVREALASEMLEALGVSTSRTLSIIETGEELWRGDEPSPTRSAVLVRLSHGHIRIGSFQRLAHERDEAGMHRLTDYVVRELYGEAPGEEPALRLLEVVVSRTARLAAQYMAAGFVHGVLNTDNINVTGESFDYGPWRFAPTWDPSFTAAYFDQTGLYAFARQPEAIQWDAMQLAVALRLIARSEPMIASLEQFAARYRDEIARALLWRLGVHARGGDADRAVVGAVERGLRRTDMPIDRFFREAWGGHAPEGWDELAAALGGYRARKPGTAIPDCSMLIDEVEAIWAPIAERDDWGPFDAKVAAVRALGAALAQ